MVVIIYYGVSSVGLAGANLVRLRRIGCLLRALRFPWVVVGDWNVSPQTLQASGFLREVGGVTRFADVEYTCDPGGGNQASHLDYLVHCTAAQTYIADVTAVPDAPWKPHLALRVSS